MKIRIVSPAKHIEKEHVEYAVSWLENQSFEVEVGQFALGQHHYFSGTEAERLQDFQEALDDPTVDVILCARGGYGSIQLIDRLDFKAFIENPKFIVGYSDITVFHNHVVRHYQSPTVHATAPLNFEENTGESLESLLNVLNGGQNRYEFSSHTLNIEGEIKAQVVGGNLSILYALIGTNSDADYRGKILFIEEIGEAIYALDRMFYALKKSGKLAQISGLIVGGMTQMKDSHIPYGKTAEEVIKSHVQELGIPVCFNFPAGHISDNRAIVLGKSARLTVRHDQVIFEQ